MSIPPLRAKLRKPPIKGTVITRPDLLRRLDEGLAGKATLVTAPPGFGKSTLVSDWLDHLESVPADSPQTLFRKTAWLSLDEMDNSLPKFVTYLVRALEECRANCCSPVLELLRQRPTAAIEALSDVLINCLTNGPKDHLVVVLDDLHAINNSAIYVFLTRFIEYAPPTLHLVLISRVDPPMPLNRWRAQGHLNELRLHDLSFTLEETAAFFHRNLDNVPSPALIESLHKRTEGWAVGIWMALLALRGQPDYVEFASHLETAKDRYLGDYLVEEVLDHQPAPVRKFLMNTAILNHFSAGLCAAVMEIDEGRTQQHIDDLLRSNVFVIELSSPPYWYRYHHQFQEMLLSRLHQYFDQAAVIDLRRRATAWLADHKFVEEGLFQLSAIPDFEAAAELVAQQRISALNELRFSDLEGWLSHIPPAIMHQRADLLLGMAWVKRDRVENRACLALVHQAADLLKRESAALSETDRKLLAAEINALQVSVDKSMAPENALALTRQGWALMQEDLARSHCSVALSFAYASQELGDLDFAMTIARSTFEQATEWPLAARCRIAHAAGFFDFCSGDPTAAEHRFRQNLLLAQENRLPVLTIVSRHGLGAIADARGQVEEAIQHHLEVVGHPFLTSGRDAVVDMYSLIGAYARCGEQEKGRPLVARLKEDARIIGSSYSLNQAAALEAYVNLTCGQLRPALLWAVSSSHSVMEATSDRIPYIRARILLADGSEASLLEAKRILQGLLKFYADSHVWYRLTEALILLALVSDRLDEDDTALALMAEAVELAIPKGGVGLFMGYGKAIARIAQKIQTPPGLSRYVDLLLTSLPAEDVAQSRDALSQALPDPLTERELDVLALLADRLSNKEIARTMTVSPHTVRNHVANIFGKLQVDSRVQAVERARELGLVPPARHR